MKIDELETIHTSLINGQRQQMVKQIKEYGLSDFWSDYRDYLGQYHWDNNEELKYFQDATISYFRITSR